jgi:hypothetical protein
MPRFAVNVPIQMLHLIRLCMHRRVCYIYAREALRKLYALMGLHTWRQDGIETGLSVREKREK